MSERMHNPGEPQRPTLDELLDQGDAQTLAQRAAEGGSTGRHIAIQSRIDDSLRRVFAEPELRLNLPQGRRLGLMRWAPWAAAAAVLLAALVGWRIWTISNRPDILGPLYHQIVAAGFKPDSVCTTDEEFSGWCRSYLRQPMYPASRPEGLEYVGWSTGRVLGPVSAILLAKVHDKPVIVVMERTDRQIAYPGSVADKGLHVFRRRIGEVVLYEVTPEASQTILPVIAAKPAK